MDERIEGERTEHAQNGDARLRIGGGARSEQPTHRAKRERRARPEDAMHRPTRASRDGGARPADAPRERITLRRMGQLYALYARMDFAWLFRDAKVCLAAITADVVGMIASISGVFLLALRFGGIGGMTRDEVLLMLGYYVCVNGLYLLLFEGNNTGHISRRIGRSQVDHMLIQPLPIAVQLLTEGFIPVSGCSGLVAGVALLGVALSRLGIALSPQLVGLLALQLMASTAILVGFNYLFGCIAFAAPVAGEEMSSVSRDALGGTLSTFPLGALATGAQFACLTLFPVGLMAWFPAQSLLGHAPFGWTAIYPALYAAALWLVTSVLFKKGLRTYAQKGVQRYRSMGHRG